MNTKLAEISPLLFFEIFGHNDDTIPLDFFKTLNYCNRLYSLLPASTKEQLKFNGLNNIMITDNNG